MEGPVSPDDLDAWKAADALAPEPSGKPWIEEASTAERVSVSLPGLSLHGRRPTPGGFLVGFSGLESERDAARDAARASAARQIETLLVAGAVDDPGLRIGARELAGALESFRPEVRSYVDRTTADRFEQEIPRDYGTLHRAAVLVRAGEKDLGALEGAFRDHVGEWIASKRTQRVDGLVTAISALALALVVLLLYAFVNAGTKGHFTRPLRFVFAAMLAIIYLAWMYVEGWIVF